MRAVVISDAHICAPEDPAQLELVEFIDQLPAPRLILLGDVFHHWWGFPGPGMVDGQPLLAALERLRARGGRVDYVLGNHDFRLGPRLRGLCDHAGGALELESGGLRLLLAHGDEADLSWGYRLTRALLRSDAVDRSVRALGEPRARALLARLAGASRHRPASPGPLVEAQRAWAAPHLRAGVQAVLMGHIHVLELAPLEGGCVVHTGDWASRRSWCWIGEGELGLMEGSAERARWAPTGRGG